MAVMLHILWSGSGMEGDEITRRVPLLIVIVAVQTSSEQAIIKFVKHQDCAGCVRGYRVALCIVVPRLPAPLFIPTTSLHVQYPKLNLRIDSHLDTS